MYRNAHMKIRENPVVGKKEAKKGIKVKRFVCISCLWTCFSFFVFVFCVCVVFLFVLPSGGIGLRCHCSSARTVCDRRKQRF